MENLDTTLENTQQKDQILQKIEHFLVLFESQTVSYKVNVQRRLNNLNNELFRKKTFDECIRVIRGKKFQESMRGNFPEFLQQNNLFLKTFLQANLEYLKKKSGFEKTEDSATEMKEIFDFFEEEECRYWNNKKKAGREIWNKKKDDILLQIMKKKYPELTHPKGNISKLRIKWKEVCAEFRKECHIVKQNDEILGKHCRERWINHLDPNMKKGNWSLEEDIQLLKNALNYKRRWCLISNELKNRSQHSLKNRFFHLMSANLNITNKACLKRKNFSDDILKIIDKYRHQLVEESEITQESKPLKTEENVVKNKEIIEHTTEKPQVKVEFFSENNKKNENIVKNQDFITKSNFVPFFQNSLNNFNNNFNNMALFLPHLLNSGLLGNGQMNGMFDPRLTFQQPFYPNHHRFFINYHKY